MRIGTIVESCPEGMFFEWVSTALYNAMLAPCFNYAISGTLWYQGESDAGRALEYKDMLKTMIELWRKKFIYSKKDMPFVVVQLPNWSDGHNEENSTIKSEWALMRQIQAQVADSCKNVGLAVTIDAGEWNDLHPEKKYTVGTRSALEALRIAYQTEKSFSPKAIKLQKKETKLKITFDCGNSSLVEKYCNSKSQIPGFSLIYQNNDDLKIVEVFGKLISKNEIEINLPNQKGKLLKVRYLWADSPNSVCLYSDSDLPASPFKFSLSD